MPRWTCGLGHWSQNLIIDLVLSPKGFMREFFLLQMYLNRVLFLSPVHFSQMILTLDSTAGKQRISVMVVARSPHNDPQNLLLWHLNFLATKIVSFVENLWWLEVETLAGVSSKLMCEIHCLCEAESVWTQVFLLWLNSDFYAILQSHYPLL